MIASPSSSYISSEYYLKGEQNSPIKHEYRRGEVYAMTQPLRVNVNEILIRPTDQ